MTIEEFLFMLDNCDINNGKTVEPHLDYPYSDGYCKMTKNAYDTYEGKIDLNKFKKLNEKQ